MFSIRALAKASVVVFSLSDNFVFFVAFVTLVAITVAYLIQGVPKYNTQLVFALFSAYTAPRNKSKGIYKIPKKFSVRKFTKTLHSSK